MTAKPSQAFPDRRASREIVLEATASQASACVLEATASQAARMATAHEHTKRRELDNAMSGVITYLPSSGHQPPPQLPTIRHTTHHTGSSDNAGRYRNESTLSSRRVAVETQLAPSTADIAAESPREVRVRMPPQPPPTGPLLEPVHSPPVEVTRNQRAPRLTIAACTGTHGRGRDGA